MQFRFSERYVMALNLALIVLLSYTAALAVNRIVADRFGATPVPASVAPASSAQVLHRSRAYYDEIVQRDIFNLVPMASAPTAIVATDLHLKLLGTSQLTRSKPFIIVADTRNGEQSLFRLGENIPDAGKLVEVEKNRAVIDHNGTRLALEIPTEAMPTAPTARMPMAARGVAPGGNEVRQIGAGRYQIARSTVNANLNNMSHLFTQIRAIPNFRNGQVDGFRLSEIQPGSIFQQMGLHDGDILLNVGGQPINNPAMAMQMLTQLRNSSEINLTVMRGGEPVNLRYQIR